MLFSADDSGREPAVRALIAADASALSMSLPADQDSLPVARQALRAFAGAGHIDDEGLEDSEIAITEALANAVEHAYSVGGRVEMTILRSGPGLSVTVRDHGRGLGAGLPAGSRTRKPAGGFGIQIIEAIADEVDFRILGDGAGTEIAMTFGLARADGARVRASEHLEGIVRRIVAVVAGQHDVSVESLRRGIEAAGAGAHVAAAHLVAPGDASLAVDRVPGGLELRLGPLTPSGAQSVVATIGRLLAPGRKGDLIRLRPSRDPEGGGQDVVLGFADVL